MMQGEGTGGEPPRSAPRRVPKPRSRPQAIQEEGVFTAETLLKRRRRRGKVQYLVK